LPLWLRDLTFDVRDGTRVLRTSPALTTITTLAIGIGIVTGFFAIVDAVVLTPLAAHGDTVVRIWKHDREQTSIARFPLSYAELGLWRDQARSFTALAAISYADAGPSSILVGDEPVSVRLAPVSPAFFAVMHDGSPLLGRWFTAAEEDNVTEMAAVVSDEFWRRVGGGDPSFVGRRLPLPGGKRTLVVVGVAPASLTYPARTDAWVPLVSYFSAGGGLVNADIHSRRFTNFHFLGRLAPGATVAQAQAELDVINRGISAQFPDDIRLLPIVTEPLLNASLGTLRPLTWFLFAGAALVFLAAGGNVAALLLMRASAQSRDIAMRLALGASQFRIARQTIAEALMLGAAGALGGLVIAQSCLVMAKSVGVTEIPRLETAAIDTRVLAFSTLVTLAWVALFGTTPLWRRRRFEAGHMTQHLAARVTRSTSMLRLMIVGQITTAVVIAIAAGLLVQSLVRLTAIDRGFDAGNMAVARVFVPESIYPTPALREQLFSRLLPRLASLPGAINATAVHLGPGTGQTGLSARMLFEGQPPDEGRTNPYGTWEPIAPSYFATLGIPIVRGRSFTDGDDGDAPPVAIVSESVADRYWPGQDPLGRRLQFTPQFPWVTVVGVAADTRYRELTRDWLTVYFPAKQFFFFSPGAVIVRTQGDPRPLFADISRAIRRVEPAAAVHSVDTMEQLLAQETARPRAAVAVATLFAIIAVFVAAVGVYGVFSYDVSTRSREFAVHSAIGATPQRLVGMTLRHALVLGATGVAIGLGLASLLTRYLTAVLFEVTSLDAWTFVFAGCGVIAMVVIASLLPAGRAARVDPVTLLRTE
jgi:putative ABC transport system permease protein